MLEQSPRRILPSEAHRRSTRKSTKPGMNVVIHIMPTPAAEPKVNPEPTPAARRLAAFDPVVARALGEQECLPPERAPTRKSRDGASHA